MDFISAPLVVGIIFYFVYMTFELFARKQERMNMIEKLGANLAPDDLNTFRAQFSSLLPTFKRSFSALRIGSLLLGLGVGLGVGLLINIGITDYYGTSGNYNWQIGQMAGVGYGASLLLFGGLGLIISFVIENRMSKNKENEAH